MVLESQHKTDRLLTWIYSHRGLFPMVSDIASWTIVMVGLPVLFGDALDFRHSVLMAAVSVLLQLVLGSWSGIYRGRWRAASSEEAWALGWIWVAQVASLVAVKFGWSSSLAGVSDLAVVAAPSLAMMLMLGSRILWRKLWLHRRRPAVSGRRRTVVVGAGNAGTQIVSAMLSDPNSEYIPVAIIDDDPAKRNREISGVRVAGTRQDLDRVVELNQVDTVVLAIPSSPRPNTRELAAMARQTGAQVRILPSTTQLMERLSLDDVKVPSIDDLLGRESVEIDLDAVAGYVKGRRVMVTGAGGSIGSELSKQIREFGPSELMLVDRDETALHSLQLMMEGRALLDSDDLVLADIRDRGRVFELFEQGRPEVVFHAAALKHLTLLERHPDEAIKTNIVGTANLLDAARKIGVERFVNVSTDKAADPTSVLGATKLAAERLTAQTAQETGSIFVSVRFGNVLGSRGSVLPTFVSQIEQGKPVTVTDPEVTRFFMTIPEAVRLVVQAGAIGRPGEVMLLDMGEPVKIVDLARHLIDVMSPDTEIVFTGLRPGEKLNEVLFADGETGRVRDHPRITHALVDPANPAEALSSLGDDYVCRARCHLFNSGTDLGSGGPGLEEGEVA